MSDITRPIKKHLDLLHLMLSNLSRGVTGEIIHVDSGISVHNAEGYRSSVSKI